jgi:hypothetical protein
MSNNKIQNWSDIDRLATLTGVEDLLLVGNPLYNDYKDQNALSEYRIEVGSLSVCALSPALSCSCILLSAPGCYAGGEEAAKPEEVGWDPCRCR